MTSLDKTSRMGPAVALDIQAITEPTTTIGNIIDTKGFESLDMVLASGVITDGDYEVTLEHGDEANLSDGAAVASTDLIGTLPSIDENDDNAIEHFGYIGKKQFVRPSIVSTNVSTGGTMGIIANLGDSSTSPTVNTPVPTS
jgi:hypothetical protein